MNLPIVMDWLLSIHKNRFIAFRLPAGQIQKGQVKPVQPALPYSHSMALESLLSVALSSTKPLDCILQLLLGLTMDPFSLLKWAPFQC